jgi:hypothetical protein
VQPTATGQKNIEYALHNTVIGLDDLFHQIEGKESLLGNPSLTWYICIVDILASDGATLPRHNYSH